jgi:alpha-tubulin suppressor-like RCC1 family protein
MAANDGCVYCCGDLAGRTFAVATKLQDFVPDSAVIRELAAGDQHVLAVCSGESGAEVFGTGDNAAGQLGISDRSSKVQLPVLGKDETYHISAGGVQSACVIIPTPATPKHAFGELSCKNHWKQYAPLVVLVRVL